MQPINMNEQLTQETVSDARARIIRLVNDAFSKNDMPLFLSQCTDNITWNMIGDNILKGKDTILQAMTAQPAGCTNITVDTTITEGNKTVATGSFSMDTKEGITATFQYCDVYFFEDDKIASMDSYVVPIKS